MAVMARWRPSATTKATSTRYAFTMDDLSNEALFMEHMAKNFLLAKFWVQGQMNA